MIQVGESVGHYQVVEELGEGASGRVLKVEHMLTRRAEAMKILAGGKPSSQESAHRFLREIRLQASLTHPNIAAVLNAFWLEEDLIMIMELIEGVSLQRLLEHRRFNLDQSLLLIRQVLLALSHAHENGVIHRDVSTANIIVNPHGHVKLTDFGLAKTETDLSITDSGSMIGSPYYMSPEQVRGATHVDHRADIYASGIVLYELLTGVRPFRGESSFLIMQAHVQQQPRPPIELNPALPQFISDAILKAIRKNPKERFQSAKEFLAALEGPEAAAPAPVEEARPTVDHSFAAPIPAETTPAAAPVQVPLWKRIWASELTGAVLGLGTVAAVVAPFVFYDFESGRPRFQSRPAVTSPVQSNATDPKKSNLPDEDLQLVPGPKLVPGTAAPGTAAPAAPVTRALTPGPTRPRTATTAPAKAATPPPIVIWGEAKSPSAKTPDAPKPATVVPPKPAPAATPIEPPPVLAPASPQVLGKINPTLEPLPPNTPRRGLFRRLANGVKALNPNRREPAEQSVAKP